MYIDIYDSIYVKSMSLIIITRITILLDCNFQITLRVGEIVIFQC